MNEVEIELWQLISALSGVIGLVSVNIPFVTIGDDFITLAEYIPLLVDDIGAFVNIFYYFYLTGCLLFFAVIFLGHVYTIIAFGFQMMGGIQIFVLMLDNGLYSLIWADGTMDIGMITFVLSIILGFISVSTYAFIVKNGYRNGL